MLTLIRQEIYKLIKKPSFLVFWIGLTTCQVVVASCALRYPKVLRPQSAFLNSFYAPIVIMFYMIAVGSTQLSSEIQFGTLKSLLYRRYSSTKILISKWLTLLLCAVTAYVGSLIVSLILKALLLNNRFSLNESITQHGKIWQAWLLTNISSFLTMLFLMSFVFLLATLFVNSTPAIITGVSTYFVALIFNQLMFMMIDKSPWLKWNPINMMNLGEQLSDSKMSNLTHLSFNQLTIGYLVYIVGFLSIGILIFKRKSIS
ncbi:ABC transporter permease protein [Lacticaseibacillus paracasei]|uniref:ABC transporter permease n=1 Tax=Lacticaseibacillus paracasei TaxID=1597 RepID=UPI00091894C9|nr:ABC transporter permease subunit [Lacticaseibacillus paracasei]GAV17059.1 ABC transporter permease protein [Lacticaseibacillus paracasei]